MIHQLLFGGFGFDAKTTGGQFVYVPNQQGVQGPQTTLNYSADEMTTWFNDGSFTPYEVPQSKYGTLTVNFNFTVPANFSLYLACSMGREMNKGLAEIALNGSNLFLPAGWYASQRNTLIANSGTTVSSMSFFCNVSGSGFNDGYVIKVENLILVPIATTVDYTWGGNDILSNIPGAIAAGP